jgi:gluconolactonase
VINKWSADSPLSVFLEKSGYTGTDVKNVGDQTISGRLAILLTGSNGLTLDGEGRLLITAMTDRNVVRLEKDGRRTLLADRYEGKRFNGPHDIAFKSDGAIYFTDTVFGMRGGADSPSREIPFSGFYLIKDGKVTLLGSDKDHPGEIPNTSKEGKHLGSTNSRRLSTSSRARASSRPTSRSATRMGRRFISLHARICTAFG